MKNKFFTLIIAISLTSAPILRADEAANEALFTASSGMNVEGVRAALIKGGDPNYLKYDRSIFSWSAQSGNADVVQALLEGKPRLDEADGIGHTPLMRAADMGHTEVVKVLLKAGANPNVATKTGETALLLATKASPAIPGLVDALVEGKADPNAKNSDEEFALLIAVRDQKPDLIPIITKAKIDWSQSGVAHTALGTAVDQGDKDAVHALLSAGADPNAMGPTNQAPLIMAMDKEEIFRLLLEAKADPNVKNSWGQTALIVAVSEDQANRVEDLIKAGASLDAKSDQDQTALQYAELQAKHEMVELLKRHGAK
jgi:ankyrin repeat protein